MNMFRFRRLSTVDGIELLDQLENLLSAGLPLDRALHILSGAMDADIRKALVVDLLLEVERGRTLAEAFSQHPAVFGPLEISMIRAGEEGGILSPVMRRLVDYQRSRREFRQFLLTSSIYPIILLIFGILAVGGILVFVVPQFVEAYGDISRAGFAAQILVASSELLVAYGVYGLLLLIFGIAFFQYWRSTPSGRSQFQRLLIGIPGLGSLLIKAELSRTLHTMGVLLTAGVPILRAVKLARGLTTLSALDLAFIDAEKSLREGRGLAKPLQNPIFPRLVGQLAVVGEESGALDQMLVRIGQRLENEVRSRMRGLLVLIEPVFIIGIGLLIGGIVVSMISAIFSLNEMPL